MDVHRLVEGRKLILGGVTIPYSLGLLGHSDADVLVHAIMDALLGAAGLRDIGYYFPDTDEKYSGISSLMLLNEVNNKLKQNGYTVINIDATIVAQNPKLAPYIKDMRIQIAETMGIKPERVNVKATTTEGLGFCGTGEGIEAFAVCLLDEL